MKSELACRESALVDYRSAVHAFSDDPSPRNLVRYLVASRALDESRNPSANARAWRSQQS
jgi:hypothetical protein